MPKRLLWIFLTLAVVFLIPFLIWGDAMESAFDQEASAAWLEGFGAWAWAAAIGLLLSDIVLPVPGTAVMAALGLVYGPVSGGLIACLGSTLSGMVAYWGCRGFGTPAAKRILCDKDYENSRRLFAKTGAWMVVLSRWLPLFPEVIACMAGLTRMRPVVFHTALVLGNLPLCIGFAYIGHSGQQSPGLALLLSALLPPVIWLVVNPLFNRSSTAHSNADKRNKADA